MTAVPPNPPTETLPPPPGWVPAQPGSTGWAPPPAAELKSRKKRRWPWVLLAILAVIAVIGIATSGKNKDSATTGSAPAADDAPASAENAAGIGTPVRDGKFEFIVESVQPGQSEIGTEPLTTKAQGEFVTVTVKVTNTADQAQSFVGSTAKSHDAAGREFSASTTAAIYLPDSSSLYEQINPGNTVTGQIVFDVPAGTTLTSIELHDSMFSDGVSVQL